MSVMKTPGISVLITCCAIASLSLVSCSSQKSQPWENSQQQQQSSKKLSDLLTVSAASIYEEALPEIADLYQQQKPNIEIDFNFGFSQTLQKELKNKPDVDIFISANSKVMDEAQAQKLLIPETRQNFAKNQLVVIVSQNSKLDISKFSDLTKDKVKKVALTNSQISLGNHTKEVLTNLKIYDKVQKKAVSVDDKVREILNLVENKQVDAGITYSNEAKRSKQVKIAAIAAEKSYTQPVSVAAVLTTSKNVSEAKAFIQFLKSDKATSILEKYGLTKIK